jgi:putative DNA primase/helicase
VENIPHDGDGRNQRLGAPNPDNIPDELKSGRFWLVWRYERGTKIPKIASTTTIQAASSTNSDTWRMFDEAMAAYKTGHFSGIGRVIVEGHGLTGLDIDKCINPETGEFDPHAEDVIRFFCSFSEISPSLSGVKIWVKGELPRSYKKAGLEVYNGGRFFTVTGRSLPWTPRTVETRQDELDAFIPAEFPRPAKRSDLAIKCATHSRSNGGRKSGRGRARNPIGIGSKGARPRISPPR